MKKHILERVFLFLLTLASLSLAVYIFPANISAQEPGSETWHIDGVWDMNVYDNDTSCFPAGTLVTMADGTSRNIENVKIDDRVMSRNELGNIVASSVVNTLRPISNNICEISYTNGRTLNVTRGHPLFTSNGWKAIDPLKAVKENPGVPVTALNVGDMMANVDGTWPQVSSISCQDKTTQTYNLTVDNAHTYYADGFLAHNKGYNYQIETASGTTVEWYVTEWTCFPKGTKVAMGSGEQKNIEDIKVGETILSQSEDGERSVSKVTALDQPVRDHMCQINFTDGEKLKLTDEHPLLTEDGWKAINPQNTFRENPDLSVSGLKSGDKVKRLDGTAQVRDFSCWSEKIQTYNLILDNGANTYFADGFLAHNKGGGGGGTWATGAVYNCPAPDWEVDFSNLVQNWCCDARTMNESWACCSGNACFHPYGEEPCYSPAIAQYQLVYGCKLTCDAGEPTNVEVTRESASSSTITWTPGANGTAQRIFVGENLEEVVNNCPGNAGRPACVVNEQNLPTLLTSYTTGSVLVPGTLYYYKVLTYKNSTCLASSQPAAALSSCDLSPSSLALVEGQPFEITSSVNSSDWLDRVTFSQDPVFFTVNPDSDSLHPYQTVVTASDNTGSSTLTSSVYRLGNPDPICTATIPIDVSAPHPWWQVMDADVFTNGNLVSRLPYIGSFPFDLPGAGDYPGAPSYGGTTNLTSATVSDTGWLAASQFSQTKMFDYNFFANQIPADTEITVITDSNVDGSFFESGGVLSYGYYWYKYSGTGADLNINTDMDITDRKVVLLVEEANLNLNGRINLTDGSGFFGAFVNGNISVNPLIGGGSPDLEGIYLADGSFSTGLASTKLHVRGSIATHSGISMQRDLGDVSNETDPSEFFEFAPDQILLFPAKLGYRRINWKEVAP